MKPEDYMKEAIKEADMSVAQGNSPFAVIVVDKDTNEIVWRDHDRVKEKCDPTAHGEINAIRALCHQFQTLSLSNFAFYTTSEPCPTCLSAMIKAKISLNYYGAETESTASLPIKAVELAKFSKKHSISVVGGILAKECLEQRQKYTKWPVHNSSNMCIKDISKRSVSF